MEKSLGNQSLDPKFKDEIPKKTKGGPRKRVSQACDRCRVRKDKCDGKRPTCTTCMTNERPCSYDAHVKKRGLPEGYVRGLEKLWGLAIREIEDVEDSVLSILTAEDGDNSLTETWNDETSSDKFVEAWRKSQISRELDRLLCITEHIAESGKRKRAEPESQPGKKIALSGIQSPKAESYEKLPSSGWPHRNLDYLADVQDSLLPSAAYGNDRATGPEPDSILSPSYANMSSAKSANVPISELPSETWNLLDVHFSYTHNWIPIIEKHDLLRTSYQYAQNRSRIPMYGHGSGDHAALWATIAYAKYQHRAINNIPCAQGLVAEMVWTAERMYSQARKLIPTEEGVFELGHVQALLLLGLTNMGLGHLEQAWLLIGQAIRVAIILGINRPADDTLKAPAKSKWKHVFLGCFVLETLLAARLNYRPQLRIQDVDVVGLIEEDGLEEWDPWTDCLMVRRGTVSRGPASVLSIFNRLVQVLRYLNEAICITDSTKKVEMSRSLLDHLQVWSSAQAFPFDKSTFNSTNSPALLPHHLNLCIAYFVTLVTIQMLESSETFDLNPATSSGKQIAHFIAEHSDRFGLLIVPPIFEFFIRTAFDVVQAINGSTENCFIQFNSWQRNLNVYLKGMEPAWPIFQFFKDSPSPQPYAPVSVGRRQSQVAYDLISGGQSADSPPMSGPTPNTATSDGRIDMLSPRTFQPLSAQMGSSNIAKSTSPVLARTTSFGQSQNMQQSPQAMFNGGNSASNGWPVTFQRETEIDPAFNEFAALDAMEWTGNWDQGLVNLGFTESDKMNQDFYTMSQQPDPLHPNNNVFQQMVANSNAEATDFLGGIMFDDMGGFGLGFGDESEGIEAGQILQSLSVAEDRRIARGNG